MAKEILITGGNNGFIGKHLAQALLQNGHTVYSDYFDVTMPHEFERVLSLEQFDIVFHLAGISHNVVCEENPSEAYRVNVIGTQLLIDAVNEYQPNLKIVFPSTAYVYDFSKIKINKKIDETFQVNPKTVYAKSKLLCEDILQIANTRWGTKSMILRLFNHTHKSQNPSFFLPGFYKQIMDPISDTINVGSINVKRDIGLIQDLITDLTSILDLDDSIFQGEIFNVCAGNEFLLSDLASELLRASHSNKKICINPERIRKNDPEYISGDMSRLSSLLQKTRPTRSISEFISTFLSDI